MTLLSFQFVVLATCAVIVLPITRGRVRTLALCALSGWFAASHLDLAGMVSTAAFIACGWGVARVAPRSPRLAGVGVALIVAAFVVVRRYSFLDAVLPQDLSSFVIATAGLSFLLFKIVHVVVDRAGGSIERLPPGEFLAYCLNFTTFLIGPIQRFQDFDEQWRGVRPSIEPHFEAHLDAVNRVMLGLTKKFVIAEFVLPYVLQAGKVEGLGPVEVLLGTWAFYLYLYLDFSGYCDVVIGVGALMGVRPPENFRMPFLAPNVSEFWLRVHRSLTTWLTDYVFNPTFAALLRTRGLGRRTLICLTIAMMTTMLVSGLWHGTTANFVIFGVVHGVLLVVQRLFDHVATRRLGRRRLRELRGRLLWRVAATALTFVSTATTYVFFVLPLSDLIVVARSLSP